VDLVSQRSPRLTFDFGGDGFVVRREDLALAGLEGYSALRQSLIRLLAAKRLKPATNQYMNFDFQRQYANAHLETVTLADSIALTRNLDLQVEIGA